MLALRGNVRAIDNVHSVRFAQGLIHQAPVLLQQRVVLPLALSNKLLHRLDIAAVQRQRHRLDRFALDGQHQPLQILIPPMSLFLTVVQIRKRRVVMNQCIGQRHDLLGAQVQG